MTQDELLNDLHDIQSQKAFLIMAGAYKMEMNEWNKRVDEYYKQEKGENK